MTHQRSSHAALLTDRAASLPRAGVAPLDAVVVPASRKADSLTPVIELAAESGIRLIVLASHLCDVETVGRLVAATPGCRASVAEIGPDYQHELFRFETSDPVFDEAKAQRRSNLSLKRNMGLMMARLMRWKKIMFVDDDVSVGAPDLRRMANQLEHHQVAGFALSQFPDNSVVCHASRLSGATQDVFVSGAALGVNCDEPPLDFFPDVYNEDWFFMAAHAKVGRVVSLGKLRQAEFNPFEDPRRAEFEEFGDLLAEGLYARYQDTYLADYDDGFVLDRLTVDYWDAFREARHDVISTARDRLVELGDKQSVRACESLGRAEKQLRAISSMQCAEFIESWRHDRGVFAKRAQDIRPVKNLLEAFDVLGVTRLVEADFGRKEIDSRALPGAPVGGSRR